VLSAVADLQALKDRAAQTQALLHAYSDQAGLLEGNPYNILTGLLGRDGKLE